MDVAITEASIQSSMDNELEFEYILKSDNPDKDLEFFWLTFKLNIERIIKDKKLINQIYELSTELNAHQINKEFDTIFKKINEFLKKNLNQIIKTAILTAPLSDNRILYKNISRWKNISPKFDNNSLEYNLLKIVKNSEKNYDVIDAIRDYLSENTYDTLNILFETAISLKHAYLIEILKTKVDINNYLENKIHKNVLDSISGSKLIKLLKTVD